MGCNCHDAKRATSPMPGLTLLDRETTPNGGYRYWQASTRTALNAPTLRILAELVIKHRLSNNIPTGGLDEVMTEVEHQICETAPPNTCRDVQGQVIASGVNMSMEDIKRGAATLWDWFKSGGMKKVDKPLAEERARVCSSCFANKEPEGCTSCASAKLREWVEDIVGGDATAHDGFLKACAFCSCQLKAKVWIPLDVLLRHTPAEQLARLPDYCWMRKEQV